MPIQFQCNSCQSVLRVADENAGKQAKCKCGAVLRIPNASATANSKGAATKPASASTPKPTAGGSKDGSVPTPPSKPKSAPKATPNPALGSLFDELTDNDWQTKKAPVPKADKGGGQSDGAFLKAYVASSKSMDESASKNASAAGAPSNSDALRRDHLSHEESIKALGLLNLVAGILTAIVCVGLLIGGFVVMFQPDGKWPGIMLMGVAAAVGVNASITIAFAKGLQKLAPWSRIVGIIFACLGLPGIPIGTLVSLYILYLFLSKKGAYVFSAQYKKVIAATPNIQCGTPIVVWILIGLLVIFAVAGGIGAGISLMNQPPA